MYIVSLWVRPWGPICFSGISGQPTVSAADVSKTWWLTWTKSDSWMIKSCRMDNGGTAVVVESPVCSLSSHHTLNCLKNSHLKRCKIGECWIRTRGSGKDTKARTVSRWERWKWRRHLWKMKTNWGRQYMKKHGVLSKTMRVVQCEGRMKVLDAGRGGCGRCEELRSNYHLRHGRGWITLLLLTLFIIKCRVLQTPHTAPKTLSLFSLLSSLFSVLDRQMYYYCLSYRPIR